MVFRRFNFFLQRCKVLHEFCSTSQQIFRLQKVEIGGVRGKILTEEVKKINDKFNNMYSVFGTKNYDCLDENDKEFMKDHNKFMSEVWKLDRKIGQVLSRAFDDCNVSNSVLKLLKVFGDLALRGLIALELSDKMPMLIIMLNEEMDESKKTFIKYKQKIKVNGKTMGEKNVPSMSSNLKFVYLLKTKIMTTIEHFKNLDHPICYSPGGELLLKKYKNLQLDLCEYEREVYNEWLSKAETKTFEGLQKPLLHRMEKPCIIKVNFAADTMAILVDVRYMRKEFQNHIIPDALKETFLQFDYYKAVHNILDQVVENYNYMKTTTNIVEQKLIEDEIKEIDLLLKPAETRLNWQSDNILQYVQHIHDIVNDLNGRVMQTQDNVISIYREISQWENIPMFTRLEGGNNELFDLEKKEEIKLQRYDEIRRVAGKISQRIQDNLSLFNIDLENKSLEVRWKKYLKFVDGIVRDSILQTIASSLAFFLDETDVNQDPLPLFAAKVELCEPDVIFRPSLENEITNNFYDIVTELIEDVFHMAKLVPRVVDKEQNFYDLILQNKELKKLKKTCIERVESVITKAYSVKNSYQSYSFLWMEKKAGYIDNFLKFSRQPNEIENKKINENNTNVMKSNSPKLEDFKKEIDYFEEIHDEIKKRDNNQVFDLWFLVDVTSLKSSLQMCAKKWSYLFKKYLLDKVVTSLTDLETFLEDAERGLQSQISEGDYSGLVKMMGLIKAVKDNQSKFNPLFGEMKNILSLLHNYNVVVPEKVFQQLNLLPEKWVGVQHLSITSKHLISSHLNAEVGKLTNKIEAFEKQQKYFRNEFLKSELFNYSCEKSYELLRKTFMNLKKIEDEIQELHSECVLFDIPVPKFKLIGICITEMR